MRYCLSGFCLLLLHKSNAINDVPSAHARLAAIDDPKSGKTFGKMRGTIQSFNCKNIQKKKIRQQIRQQIRNMSIPGMNAEC